MIYKVLQEKDIQQYREVRLECLRLFPNNFGTTYEEEAKTEKLKLEDFICKQDATTFMYGAFDNDKLVGICGFVRETRLKTKHRGEIVQMYINPNFAGKGIGKELLKSCINKAFENTEIEQIVLTVVAENQQAVNTYAKIGFKSYGHLANYFKSGNEYTPQEFMILTRNTYHN